MAQVQQKVGMCVTFFGGNYFRTWMIYFTLLGLIGLTILNLFLSTNAQSYTGWTILSLSTENIYVGLIGLTDCPSGQSGCISISNSTYPICSAGKGIIACYSFAILFTLTALLSKMFKKPLATSRFPYPNGFLYFSYTAAIFLYMLPLILWIQNCHSLLTQFCSALASCSYAFVGWAYFIAVICFVMSIVSLMFQVWRQCSPRVKAVPVTDLVPLEAIPVDDAASSPTSQTPLTVTSVTTTTLNKQPINNVTPSPTSHLDIVTAEDLSYRS